MGELYTITARQKRMESALRIIQSRKSIPYSKAVALLAFNLGIREEKAREYIRILEKIDGFKIKDGIIINKKKS